MVCMLMHSRRSVTRFGGIGVMALTAGDGTMAGDGIVLTMLGDITPATGVAGMAVDIGVFITIGLVVLAGAGAEVETIGLVTLITMIVVLILEIAEEALDVLLIYQAEIVE